MATKKKQKPASQKLDPRTRRRKKLRYSTFDYLLFKKPNQKYRYMDPTTFFAGLQALAAFLQVWQAERKPAAAADAYFRAKEQALSDPQVIARAKSFQRHIAKMPKFAILFKNRVGRCEDKFEDALRDLDEERLDEAWQAFAKCKCLILELFRKANHGDLEDYADDWNTLECDLILGRK